MIRKNLIRGRSARTCTRDAVRQGSVWPGQHATLRADGGNLDVDVRNWWAADRVHRGPGPYADARYCNGGSTISRCTAGAIQTGNQPIQALTTNGADDSFADRIGHRAVTSRASCSSELIVHDLSLAPCADFKILATRHFKRIRLRIKNSTRWLVFVRELATAGRLGRAAVVGDKGSPASSEISWPRFQLDTVCCSPSADCTTQSNTASERSSLIRSSAVRRDPTKLTPNLHQGGFETDTKRVIGEKKAKEINGRGDRI